MGRVTSAEPLTGYRLRLAVEYGIKGRWICQNAPGPVFEPLMAPAVFRQMMVDEFGAVCWPNGADLAPDALYEAIAGALT